MSLNVFIPNFLKHRDDHEELITEFIQKLDKEIQLYLDAEPPTNDYHILVNGHPTEEQLKASPSLNALVIPWAGLPVQTAELMMGYPQISVHNLHHNAVSTSETALSLLFSAAKQTHVYDTQLRQNDWSGRYQPNPAVLLAGKTMLVLGYGSIGQHIAKVALAMGMQVKGIRRRAGIDSLGVEYFPAEALTDLLPDTNVLMITIPLTDATEGMIGEERLSLLKDPAILVNVGRGPVVDQEALYEALKSGKLTAVGIDVWYNYPPDEAGRKDTPPSDYPLNEFPNVVFSPHRGGGAKEIEYMRLEHLAKLLNAAGRDETIPNKVDLSAGY